VGSSTVAVGTDHQLHAGGEQRGTGHAERQPQRQHPVAAEHHAGARISSAVNGSASTASFRLSGSTFAGSVTIASGGTVTVTIEVTAISTGSYTNTLTVLVPAGTTNLGSTTATCAGCTVTNVVNITTSKTVGSSTVAVGLTTSFTLVVSNAGPGTLSRQPQRQHPVEASPPRWRGSAARSTAAPAPPTSG
jgi:hypothetical protein